MNNKLLVHKHLIIRAESKEPPNDEATIKKWLLRFIKNIGMKPLIHPIAKYCEMVGNRGLTAVAIIETSHIVIHTWDEVKPALMQIDIYSCGEFDEKKICKKLNKDFNLTKIEFKYLNRETGLTDISSGIINY